MTLIVGDVAVEFTAKLDQFFKGLDKVAERLEKISSKDSAIELKIDDKVLGQLDRITVSVENLSDLATGVKDAFLGIFDTLDGKIGNLSEQVEDSVSGTIKSADKLSTDWLTRFTSKVSSVLHKVSPLALAQVLGLGLAIEKIVKAGFDLKVLIPTTGRSLSTVLSDVLSKAFLIKEAARTFDLTRLSGLLGVVGSNLLSITSVVGLLFGSVKGVTSIVLRFLQSRPEGVLQEIVQLVITLNRGVNELLLKSQRIVDRIVVLSTSLVALSTIANTMLTFMNTGVLTLSSLITPIFSGVILGLALFKRLSTLLKTGVLRFRAFAGDGRAQTLLFIQALRGLFPIVEALSDKARPIAKAIKRMLKGDITGKLDRAILLVQTGVLELKQLNKQLTQMSATLTRSLGELSKKLGPVMDKAAIIRKQMGRKGSRDSIDGINGISSAVGKLSGATKKATTRIVDLNKQLDLARTSVSKGLSGVLTEVKNTATKFAPNIGSGLLALFLLGPTAKITNSVTSGVSALFSVIKQLTTRGLTGTLDKIVIAFGSILAPIGATLSAGFGLIQAAITANFLEAAVISATIFGPTFVKIAIPFLKGLFGKDGIGGLLKSSELLNNIGQFFSKITKKTKVWITEFRGKLTDRLVDIFQNAEKPVLKEIGDLAIASSNLFVNSFATIANPLLAFFDKKNKGKRVQAAAFAFGAALGKTISSAIAVSFKISSTLFKLVGKGFSALGDKIGKPFAKKIFGGLGKAVSGLGGLFGKIGGVFKGRTGVAAKDPEQRSQRKADEVKRRKLAALEAKQTQEVIEVNKEAVRLFSQNNKAAKEAQKALARMNPVIGEFGKDLEGVPLDQLRKGVRDQIDEFSAAAALLEKVDTDYKLLIEKVRAAAKATNMSIKAEEALVANINRAASQFDPLRTALKGTTKSLSTYKDQLKDQGDEFRLIDAKDTGEKLAVLNKVIISLSKKQKAAEKLLEDDAQAAATRVKAGKSLMGKRAKGEKLLRKAEKEAAKSELERAKSGLEIVRQQDKSLRAQIKADEAFRGLAENTKKASEGLREQIKNVDNLSTTVGRANSGLQKAFSGFGAPSIAKTAKTLEESGVLVANKLDAQAANIEAGMQDAKALRKRREILATKLQNEIAEEDKQTAVDKEILFLDKQIAKLGGKELTTTQKAVDSSNKLITSTDRATKSFNSLAQTNDAARKSMAKIGKSTQRSQGVKGGADSDFGDLLSQIMSGTTKKELVAGGGKGKGDLKNNPIFKFFKQLSGEAAKSSEVIQQAFSEIPSNTAPQIAKLQKNLKSFFDLIARANKSGDFEALDKIVENFGLESIEAAERLFTASKGFKKALSQLGEGKNKIALGGKQKNILGRELIQSVKEGITDVEALIQQFKLRIQADPAFKKGFKLKVDKAKFAESLEELLNEAGKTVEKKSDGVVQGLADRIQMRSPPKKGPLRKAMLSFSKFGPSLVEQMKKGSADLAKGTEDFLKPIVDRIQFKSPPKKGGLRKAVLSMVKMPFGMSKEMLKGTNNLRKGTTKLVQVGMVAPIRIGMRQVQRIIRSSLGPLGSLITANVSSPLDNFFSQTATKLKDLGLLANRLRMNPARLKTFQDAIDLMGGSAQEAESSLTQLGQTIDRAVTEGPVSELALQFSRAGIAFEELQTLAPDELFLRLSAAVNQADGDLEAQSKILRLLGAEFTQMRGIILEGTDAMQDAFTAAAKKPVLTDKTIKLAKEFTTQMSHIKQTLEKIGLIIFEEVAPLVREITKEVSGGILPSMNQVLETARAGARILVGSIKLIAAFIRRRWIDAEDGLNNFIKDVTSVIRSFTKLVGRSIGIILDKIPPLVSAGLTVLWALITGQSKSAMGGLLADALAMLQTLGAVPVSLFSAVWEKLKFLAKSLLIQVKRAVIEVWQWILERSDVAAKAIFKGLTAGINGVFSSINAAAKFLGFESIDIQPIADIELTASSLAGALNRVNKEADDLKDEFDESATFGEDFSAMFEELSQSIDGARDSLKDMFDVKISRSELNLAIKEIAKTSESAEETLERLKGILKQISPEDVLLDLSIATTDEIKERLQELAEAGRIIPGTITEGRARLIEETTAAFEAAGGEVASAFGDAFLEAGKTVKDISPEVFALGMQLQSLAEHELAQIQKRVEALRKEGLSAADAINKVIREASKGPDIRAITSANLKARRERTELIGFGRSLSQTMRDMAGEVGPFTQASREVSATFVEMDEALLSIEEKFFELGGDLEKSALLARQFGVDTSIVAEHTQRIAEAMQEVVTAGIALSATTSDDARKAAINRLREAEDLVSALELDKLSIVEGLSQNVRDEVITGFEDGAKAIKKGPITALIKENLVAPVLNGFRDTVRGLVDGSLLEAAKSAEVIAEQTGQKFSRALFMVGQFGQQIFENAFNSVLDTLTETLTTDLSEALADSFTSDNVEDAAGGLGDVAGKAIGAALQAGLAVAGLLMSRLQSEVKASKEQIESIIDSTEAVRGVISGTTTVAIKEAQDTLIAANRPIVTRLDELIQIGRAISGTGGNIPSTPLAGAAGTTL